ncbi:RNA polymerase principal sigma factor hrdB [Slackia heliotrinireducens]|uniref:RNA polymerase sigma factor, sigma-70 family n=1 Tax=Slackia heliotrinireducens (strain ATCC 29202 / DSM 20476 / NCTC 11029 / RHS 1) TaxID=471855 RepID=C7N2D1_SLAHD|nr:sigma-70 family RNA polymerase sigma factor [Slackia heliotrinireducens]ACV21437.1 RNA polymerase sigma factor, sigma-70 family [Slackia heliotrinireducens DSM 20476]VEG98876.1 RNA polymerase principal sigma factor hrdB [Slackia heliotrinireducens]
MADTPANSANEFNTENTRPEHTAEAPTAGAGSLQDMANEYWVDDDTRTYLLEIDRFPLLDSQEEADLVAKIRAGAEAADQLRQASQDGVVLDDAEARRLARIQSDGDAAKEQLVGASLRLVARIAKRYIFRGVSFMDLVHEGNMGLIRAAERFDPASGAAFSVYASWWIRAAISRATGRGRWGCFPLDPSETFGEGEIETALSSMSERERDYIRFRFGLENGSSRTFGESAPEPGVVCTLPSGITRERARQIEAKFLAKLRNLRGTLGT